MGIMRLAMGTKRLAIILLHSNKHNTNTAMVKSVYLESWRSALEVPSEIKVVMREVYHSECDCARKI
jgi:hypothetical protein